MPTVPDIHRRGTRADQATVASPPLTVGTLYFVTDEGVTERWDGAAWEVYSGLGTGDTPPPPPPGTVASTFLVSGGQVVWEAAYTFRVSASTYYIDGTRYTSLEDTVTLTAADATLDRIDVIALDTLGAVVAIAGTLAATPSEPSVDPAAYLKLALVLVTHATSEPAALDLILVYAEQVGSPTEWNWATSAGSLVLNSTTTPHAGTKCIEGTAVAAGAYVQATIGSGSIDPTEYDHLLCFLRSKAAWNSSRGLLVTLRLSGVLVGAAVQIRRSGTFGFDSTLLSDYQMVAIPLVAFAVPQGSTINQVRFEDFGGSIGFFLDDISFQVDATTPVGSGLTQDQADARYAPLVHAPRHSSGGADPVTVTALAGFPGGTSTFLRADATFASAAGAPAAHATSHQSGGGDPIALDTLAATTDVTTLNASTSAHGLLRKLDNVATHFLDGQGAWSTPVGAGDVVGPAASIASEVALFDGTTGKLLKRATGTGYAHVVAGVLAVSTLTRVIGMIIGDGTNVISTGVQGFLSAPVTGTITKVRLLSSDAAVTSGSIVVDVWKDTYANYPPVVGDSITASAKPTITTATKSEDSTLTGWTTAVTAGDVFGFKVDSVTSLKRVTLELHVAEA